MAGAALQCGFGLRLDLCRLSGPGTRRGCQPQAAIPREDGLRTRREDTMYQKTAAEHLAEALTRLSKHPHPFAHPEAEAPPRPHAEAPKGPAGLPFTIAFSRE